MSTMGLFISFLFLMTSWQSGAVEIPEDALMKTWSSVSGAYVFKSECTVSSIAELETHIFRMANAASTRGGVIFIESGTYTLTNTLTLHGQGVQLVGLRDPATGEYPTFVYGDSLYDPDYDVNSANPVLNYPAAIRVKGTAYDMEAGDDSYMGIYGVNIQYAGSSLTTTGGMATALAMHRPDSSLFHDITIVDAYNGVDIGSCMHPRFRNIRILNVRGEYGMRCGIDGQRSDPIKIHGVTVTGTNTVTLLRISTNMELIGVHTVGGKVAIEIDGPSWTNDLSNVYVRSAWIEEPAEQGVLIQDAHNVYLIDTKIEGAGHEAIRVESGWDSANSRPYGFRGGLQISGLRTEDTGYSAIRVMGGMNLAVADAVLLGSGQRKAYAAAADLPVAGIYVDGNVASLNLVGARIGNGNEDWGVYWSTNVAHSSFPWHAPIITAGHVNFFSNITTAMRTNTRGAGVPMVELSNVGAYYTLYNAGYFDALAGDDWSIQAMADEPDITPTTPYFDPVRGFNMYDLPCVRDAMWINLRLAGVVDETDVTHVKIDENALHTLMDTAVAAYTNVVLYLPAGEMRSVSYQRRIYELDRRFLMDKPNVYLVGDGLGVTQINVPHQSVNSALPPMENAIKIHATSNSGIFGLSFIYEKAIAMPATGPNNTGTVYKPPFRVQGGSQGIRLANLGSSYSLGGGVSIVDSKNVELYNLNMQGVINIYQNPSSPQSVVSVIGTTAGAVEDIRMYQVFGGFLKNLWVTDHWTTDNSAEGLSADNIPEMTWVSLKGHVNRVRMDYSTFIQGKNGLETLESYGGTPQNISLCRFSVDHIYENGVNFIAVTNADIHSSWLNGRLKNSIAVESGVRGSIRLYNCVNRSFGLEGVRIEGGDDVRIVNGLLGNNCNLWAGCVAEDRPFSGIYIGDDVGQATLVGGTSGWLFNADESTMDVNSNEQNWGVILGPQMTNYTHYGVALYGNGGSNAVNPASPVNIGRGLGRQNSDGSTSGTWISDDVNYDN